ncbi:MAG TPA: LPS export ABC transporter periplasmic protein LptC [Terriglobales bacterium]|jgi:lipopolysaccharide export system protein LptA|nr:LPS export ABC transporter periplasmic protein LptC [Terriglobales bacterium]
MPSEISRLRRWIAIAAITLTLAVAGIYFYSQQRVQNALNQVPEKIGLDIQQTAHGFTISKSEQGRTLFKVQASKAVQFKQGGRAELHDVTITLFGRDSSRFDQIYGATFDYDPQSGDVVGKGEVQIDLQSNPEGVTKPDQSPPKELKNPIHLKTTELAFNQKTGNASTREKVDFYIPGATGSAVGVDYAANTSVLTLQSQVNIVFSGSTGATVTAIHGTITKDPHLVVLDLPHLQAHSQQSDADQATLFLRPDNTVERLLALGHVRVESEGKQPAQVRSDQLEMLMGEQQNTVRTAIFSHNVQMEVSGTQPMQGSAGRAILHFVGKNQLTTVHTEENVKLTQHQKPATSSATAQDLELTAPVVDFWLTPGNLLKRAQTSGAAKITIRPATSSPGQETLITAGKFTGRFDQFGQLSSVHGAPNGRIVNENPGQTGRVSTSDTLDASFRTGVGIESIVQQGRVFYVDDERKAWSDRARYTPADQMLFLTGAPRVIDGSSTTTAHTMRMNRATGDAFAEGDIRSTYSELKEQPNGALLASSSPIHVTSRSMTGHRSSAVAVYTGDARLWQDANLVKAPTIEFDRDHRSMVAEGSPTQPVSTTLVQVDKNGKVTPVAITSAQLTYTDSERKAHFDGGVEAKGSDAIITSVQADVFLQPREQGSNNQPIEGPGKIDHIIAREHVVMTQPTRRGTGDNLVYTAADDKFVLTGGPPSIFDAERGRTTGVSLTFFRGDDRVLVEGNDTSPTVTHTRVAR